MFTKFIAYKHLKCIRRDDTKTGPTLEAAWNPIQETRIGGWMFCSFAQFLHRKAHWAGTKVKKDNGRMEINPSVFLNFPVLSVSDSGSPRDNLRADCFCKNCWTGSRDRHWPDSSRRKELESIVKNYALMRPHRRRYHFNYRKCCQSQNWAWQRCTDLIAVVSIGLQRVSAITWGTIGSGARGDLEGKRRSSSTMRGDSGRNGR